MKDLIYRDDLLSRCQYVLNHGLAKADGTHPIDVETLLEVVKNLPSAQPERKKGRWIDDGKGLYMCSSCGKLWMHWWASVVPPNQMCKELRYCPSCGADMRGEQDEKM